METFIIPLELDEDKLILNMIPEENQLLSSSLQAEFEKELSYNKDELEHLKKEEKIPFTLEFIT